MIISDEDSYPVIIDCIDTPTKTEYFWVLDLLHRDFMLTKLLMFEEISAPTIAFKVLNFLIEAPADWHILVYSEETSQLDVIEVSELTKGGFSAFVMDHRKNKVISNIVRVVDYTASAIVHTPSLNKHEMLCHPLGPDMWAFVAPTDIYNKFLKDIVIGDLLT